MCHLKCSVWESNYVKEKKNNNLGVQIIEGLDKSYDLIDCKMKMFKYVLKVNNEFGVWGSALDGMISHTHLIA